MSNCKNCNSEISGNYCSNCGRPAQLKRIDATYIKNGLGHLLHLEKGFFHTIKELIIRPGKSVREFLLENRNRLVEPVIFLIISSLLYTLIVNFFHIEGRYISFESTEDSTLSTIFNWLQSQYGYINLTIGIFMAFWTKIFFRKYGYNYFEILILLCFVMGIQMLISSLFGIIEVFAKIHLQQAATMIGLIYISWAIGQFFENKLKNYLKVFVAYILGAILFAILVIFIGVTIDLIIK